MATFDFVIDRSMVGQTIGPQNGWLIDLRQTQSGSNEPAMADPTGKWLTGYLQLRGSLDPRDIYCAIPSQNFMNWSGKTKILIANTRSITTATLWSVACRRMRCLRSRCPMSN